MSMTVTSAAPMGSELEIDQRMGQAHLAGDIDDLRAPALALPLPICEGHPDRDGVDRAGQRRSSAACCRRTSGRNSADTNSEADRLVDDHGGRAELRSASSAVV